MRGRATFASVIGAGLLMATAAVADPYNPGERALGGGVGAVAGAATTPARPRSGSRRHYHYVHHRYY